MNIPLYVLLTFVSAFLFHGLYLKSNKSATQKSRDIASSFKKSNEFVLNESAPLRISFNLRAFPLMLIMMAAVISSHYIIYYFTGVSPIKNIIYPFADGLGLFLIYNFTLFAGLRPPLLTTVYIDKEKIICSRWNKTCQISRVGSKVYFRNIADDLYHCVIQSSHGSESVSVFVDRSSLNLLGQWGGAV